MQLCYYAKAVSLTASAAATMCIDSALAFPSSAFASSGLVFMVGRTVPTRTSSSIPALPACVGCQLGAMPGAVGVCAVSETAMYSVDVCAETFCVWSR